MSRPGAKATAVFLIAVYAAYLAVTLLKGGLFLGFFEADIAHLLDLSMRLARGQVPHQDFVTPLGVLAYAPMALFLSLGMGAGYAIIFAQALVALALMPGLWWVACSRLSRGWAYLFCFYGLLLVMALSRGPDLGTISLGMHYNRWAWAAAYLVVVAAVLPPLFRKSQLADGAVIGLGLAFLALVKLTYFVALAPLVVLALILRRQWPALGVSVLSGLAVMGTVTACAGVGFWAGYLEDLIAVTRSAARPYPNEPLMVMLRQPEYMGGTLLMLLAIVLLRQARQSYAGLVLLAFAPAVFYIAFQNFGNDPQWMVLAVILIVAMRPEGELHNVFGWNLRAALGLVAAGLAALASPAALNMAYSPMIHFNQQASDYGAFLPTRPEHASLRARDDRAYQLKANIRLDVPAAAPSVRAKVPDQEATMVNGEALEACEVFAGAVGYFRAFAEELTAAGVTRDDHVMVADIINVVWMFGDFEPLPGGSPWYYGGAPGLESADFLLVPQCPYRMSERHRILGEVTARGYSLTEAYRGESFILFKPVPAG